MPVMITSKITERSQTTLPSGVREVLNLVPGERIGYIIKGNKVELVNASATEDDDPILGAFLDIIEHDIKSNPDHVRDFPKSLLARARKVSHRVRIDHDSEIDRVTAL